MQAKIDALKNQAEVFLQQGKQNEARACYRKILALGRWKRNVPPRDLFEAHLKLGEIYQDQRKWRVATFAFWRALNVTKGKKIGLISPEAATVLEKLAFIYQVRAEGARLRMFPPARKHVYGDHQVTTYWQADSSYWEGGFRNRKMETSRYYREWHQVIADLLQDPVDYPESVATRFSGARLTLNRDPEEAAALCRGAHQECMRLQGETHPHTLDLYAIWRAYTAIAFCDYANRHFDITTAMARAEQAITEVQQVKARLRQADRKLLFKTLAVIGFCYARRKRYDEAQPFFEEKLAAGEMADSPDIDELTLALCDLAQCAYYQGRYDEAEQYDRRLLAILEKMFGKNQETAQILNHLVEIYKKRGDEQKLIQRTRERAKLIGGVTGGSIHTSLYRF